MGRLLHDLRVTPRHLLKHRGFTHVPLSFPDLSDLEDETTDVFAGVARCRLALAQTDVGANARVVGEGG
jgi:hypothetical protein